MQCCCVDVNFNTAKPQHRRTGIMNWTEIFQRGCNSLFNWGPGMLIAALILYGLFRLANGIGLKIVAALEKPAAALNRQAESMDKRTGSIQNFVDRDCSETPRMVV